MNLSEQVFPQIKQRESWNMDYLWIGVKYTVLMNGVVKVGGQLHLSLNPERLRKLTENYIFSNAKIKKALGVERMPVDTRTGLQRTLKSFQ